MPTGSPTRDRQRAAVYDAEHLVQRIFDRAWEFPTVEVAGSRLALPPERHFGSLDDVQLYIDRVRRLPILRERYPRAEVPLTLRQRRGQASAHYERLGAVVALPPYAGGKAWALRELVVLHELAHHLATDAEAADQPQHGPAFTGRFIDLVGEIIGPEAGLLLRVTYADCGVAVG